MLLLLARLVEEQIDLTQKLMLLRLQRGCTLGEHNAKEQRTDVIGASCHRFFGLFLRRLQTRTSLVELSSADLHHDTGKVKPGRKQCYVFFVLVCSWHRLGSLSEGV